MSAPAVKITPEMIQAAAEVLDQAFENLAVPVGFNTAEFYAERMLTRALVDKT